MTSCKADIIAGLQRDILLLQGFKPASNDARDDMGLGPINEAFPNATFPVAAVHEFLLPTTEHTAATFGFISVLLGHLMKRGGACIWISSSGTAFPPAFKVFGIEPDKVIFVEVKKTKDILWVMEEALKCEGLAAVVGEVKEISFTETRRLQLAVEKSKVTGFILRSQPRDLNGNACVSRWIISPLASKTEDGMPGMGFPVWNIELVKIRNGRPGVWQVEWSAGELRQMEASALLEPQEVFRKTG